MAMEIKTEYETEIGPTQVVFEVIDVPNTTKKIVIWSESETQQLLDLYENFYPQVGPHMRFKHKKDMWTEIATHFPGRHRKQCEERYKTVLKRKKKGLPEANVLEAEEWEENPIKTMKILEEERAAEEQTKTFRNVNMWTNSETRLLMSLHRTLIKEVGKRFTFQKDMWREIATNFPGKQPNQCEQRYKTVQKRKKKCVYTKSRRKTNDFKNKDSVGNSIWRNNRIAKNHINKCTNDTEMDELITLGEEVNNVPKTMEVITENISDIYTKIPQSSTTKEPFKQERKDLSLAEILWEIAAKKEEAKERRHRERMEATKQLQNILQQILNSKNIS
ncbi:uncharacterized protein LOC111685926 [Lucilia cuprina]|uniref:uncharacterized protein LOC111685926 n=1 Tax=Lucilia cuprina TaxID=7375 RepID=UPI001F061263|nr:uncharacterized protein LOC111685926 [Lucilia cuprina]